ncbi:hypothetical protein [Salisediminibacterium beveridgei]|uniref:tRNA nucleotidyltransferase n=1 Tax=Salisediminibacterium beveridgei TaxID=632773 RepID=A0A1D7QUZ2_9BACI|nr:hypothetical protein [Salisediminibacterium beveridgei]AOM82832.1 tRNA nucleotidyltransferase [Salisediminibacterium beveridgei]
MNHWEIALSIQKTLIQHGYPTYITGGAVRDRFMDKDSADIDLATFAEAETIQQLFSRTEPVGAAFGTVLVIEQGVPFEVTSVRGDSIEDDLGSRDFSINAMALDADENLIDPFQGKRDIQQKMIETVKNPDITLRDDPLRMLRALRFSLQFSFEASERILSWTKMNHHLMKDVAIERIVKEWEKVAFIDWDRLKVNNLLLHPLTVHDAKLFPDRELKNALMMSGFPVASLTREQWWMFTLFDKDNLDQSIARLKTMKLPNAIADQVKKTWKLVISFFQSECLWTNRQLFNAGEQSIYDACLLIQVYRNDDSCFSFLSCYQRLPIHSRNDLQVNGDDLIQYFPTVPKRSYKQLFSKMIDAVLAGRIYNEREALLNWVKEYDDNEN